MFRFKFFDAFEFGDAEASVFALPVVVGRLTDTVLVERPPEELDRKYELFKCI